MERLRRGRADHLVHLFSQCFAGVGRSRGNGNDDARGLLLADGRHRSVHGRASGQAVIDENHGFPAHVGSRALSTISMLATLQFSLLARRHTVDNSAGYFQALHDVMIENAYPAAGDRPHGELFMAGNAQLAHQKYIERRT